MNQSVNILAHVQIQKLDKFFPKREKPYKCWNRLI